MRDARLPRVSERQARQVWQDRQQPAPSAALPDSKKERDFPMLRAIVYSLSTFLVSAPLWAQSAQTGDPAAKRTFEENVAIAKARLLKDEPKSPVKPTPSGSVASAWSNGRSTGPLAKLSAAYFQQAQRLARIAPQLPDSLRKQVELEIQDLQVKREGVESFRRQFAQSSERVSLPRNGLAGASWLDTNPARPLKLPGKQLDGVPRTARASLGQPNRKRRKPALTPTAQSRPLVPLDE